MALNTADQKKWDKIEATAKESMKRLNNGTGTMKDLKQVGHVVSKYSELAKTMFAMALDNVEATGRARVQELKELRQERGKPELSEEQFLRLTELACDKAAKIHGPELAESMQEFITQALEDQTNLLGDYIDSNFEDLDRRLDRDKQELLDNTEDPYDDGNEDGEDQHPINTISSLRGFINQRLNQIEKKVGFVAKRVITVNNRVGRWSQDADVRQDQQYEETDRQLDAMFVSQKKGFDKLHDSIARLRFEVNQLKSKASSNESDNSKSTTIPVLGNKSDPVGEPILQEPDAVIKPIKQEVREAKQQRKREEKRREKEPDHWWRRFKFWIGDSVRTADSALDNSSLLTQVLTMAGLAAVAIPEVRKWLGDKLDELGSMISWDKISALVDQAWEMVKKEAGAFSKLIVSSFQDASKWLASKEEKVQTVLEEKTAPAREWSQKHVAPAANAFAKATIGVDDFVRRRFGIESSDPNTQIMSRQHAIGNLQEDVEKFTRLADQAPQGSQVQKDYLTKAKAAQDEIKKTDAEIKTIEAKINAPGYKQSMFTPAMVNTDPNAFKIDTRNGTINMGGNSYSKAGDSITGSSVSNTSKSDVTIDAATTGKPIVSEPVQQVPQQTISMGGPTKPAGAAAPYSLNSFATVSSVNDLLPMSNFLRTG